MGCGLLGYRRQMSMIKQSHDVLVQRAGGAIFFDLGF